MSQEKKLEEFNSIDDESKQVVLDNLAKAENTISQLNLQIQMMSEQMRHERENYLEMISQVNARYGQVATENMLLVNQNQ